MNLQYRVLNSDISIKQILKEKFDISERLILKLKKYNKIQINSKPVYINHSIKENDILDINLDFDEESENIVPNESLKLNILFEDECLLIVDKPSGITVHPSILHFSDSLSNGVKAYFNSNHIFKKIRPVNRLDKDTSGIVVFAKNEYIQESLVKQMKNNVFEKYYIGIVEGILDKKQGTIIAPIARKENSIIEREINFENGENAITHYKVLKESNNFSKVEFKLETGRTHQIRLHCKYIMHPIIGDFLYGKKQKYLNRHLLHSYKIKFIHPLTKKELEICSNPPEIFEEILS